MSDEWADAGADVDGVQGGLGSLMHLKQRHPHLRVLLSIGGGSSVETFPLVANSGEFRHNFASSAKGLVEASGLDGIDGEYHHPRPGCCRHQVRATANSVRCSCVGIPV